MKKRKTDEAPTNGDAEEQEDEEEEAEAEAEGDEEEAGDADPDADADADEEPVADVSAPAKEAVKGDTAKAVTAGGDE